MLIILILIVLIIIGIVWLLIDEFCFGANYLIVLPGIILLVCLGVIVFVQINSQKDYENMQYEKSMIEYRIEHINDDLVGNELLYEDIVKFNNKLREEKFYANSLWVNWFCNQKIASIDFIEFDAYGG